MDDIYVFTCPGVSSMIMLKQKASGIVKNTPEVNDDVYSSMEVLSKLIKEEAANVPNSKSVYGLLDTENLLEECSDALLTFSSKLSPNFEKSLAAVLIGKIVTSVITNRFTKLQLSLSVLANDKKLIDHFHQYGIT